MQRHDEISHKTKNITSQLRSNDQVIFWHMVWGQRSVSKKRRLQYTSPYTYVGKLRGKFPLQVDNLTSPP